MLRGRSVLAPDPGDEPERTARLLGSWPDDGGTRAVLARLVRARTARVPPSSGHDPNRRAVRSGSSPGSGASTTAPGASARGRMTFSNRSWLWPISRTARCDDRRRAAVVDLEIDSPEARQRCPDRQHATDIGEAPAVDRLVVVTHQEDAVRRRGEQQRKTELRAVDVLHLVDEQVRAPSPPPIQCRRLALEDLESAPDEVVEIEATMLRERPLVRDEGTRDRPGAGVGRDVVYRGGQVQLQPRERGDVQAAPLGRRCPRPQVGDQLGAVDQRFDRPAGIAEDLATQGVERPQPDFPGATPNGSSAAWVRSPSSSAARLLNVIAAIVAGSAPPSTSHATRPPGWWSCHCQPARRTGRVRAVRSRRSVGRAPVGKCVPGRRDGPCDGTIGPGVKPPLTAVQWPHGGPHGDRCQRTGTEGGRDHAPNRPIGSWRVARPKGRFPYARHDGASFVPAWTRGLIEMLVDHSAGQPCCRSVCSSRSPARRRRIWSLRTRTTSRRSSTEQVPRRRRPRGDGLRRRALPARMPGIQHVDANQSVSAERGRASGSNGVVVSVSTATLAPLTTPWAADSVGCPDSVPSQEGGAFSHVVLRAPTTAGMQTFTIMWNRAVDPMGSNDGNATGRTATTVSFSMRVVANTAPTLTVPASFTAEADTESGWTSSWTVSAADAKTTRIRHLRARPCRAPSCRST